MTIAIRRRSLVPTASDSIATLNGHPIPAAGAATGFAAALCTALQEIEHTEFDPGQRVQPTAGVQAAPVPGPLIVAGIVVPARLPR